MYETAFGPFSWRDLLKKKFWKYYAMLIVLSVVVALAVIFHDECVLPINPAHSQTLQSTPADKDTHDTAASSPGSSR